MNLLRNKRFVVAVVGTIIAIAVHYWNAQLSDLPQGLHTTADDASYLRPAENFADDGTWKDNSVGASAYVQRPPLMGIIHLPFYLLFGNDAGSAQLVFFFLLHGLALYHLPAIFARFIRARIGLLLTYAYALLPCFWGFLSYQITEAVSPSLVILLIAALVHTGKYSLATALFLFCCCWMLRPVLVLLFPALLVVLWQRRREFFTRNSWWNLVVLCGVVILTLGWEQRKAGYMGEPGELHPIYHATNESVFRPVHASLTNVFRVWETRPEVFHAIVAACWSTDSTYRSLDFLRSYCRERSVPLPPEQLHQLLQAYAKVDARLLPQFGRGKRLAETSSEINLRLQLNALADLLEQECRLQYHLATPARGAYEQLHKSQLNLELFQSHYRGTVWVTLLRYLCVGVILATLLLTLLALFSRDVLLKSLATGAVLFLFYLFYVQRLNEDRYLIPLLPLLFITGLSYLGRRFYPPVPTEDR